MEKFILVMILKLQSYLMKQCPWGKLTNVNTAEAAARGESRLRRLRFEHYRFGKAKGSHGLCERLL